MAPANTKMMIAGTQGQRLVTVAALACERSKSVNPIARLSTMPRSARAGLPFLGGA